VINPPVAAYDDAFCKENATMDNAPRRQGKETLCQRT
jgi:hypothetical protein